MTPATETTKTPVNSATVKKTPFKAGDALLQDVCERRWAGKGSPLLGRRSTNIRQRARNLGALLLKFFVLRLELRFELKTSLFFDLLPQGFDTPRLPEILCLLPEPVRELG